MKEKLFLTGGGGFLGTNILREFSKKYDIITIDRGARFSEIKPNLPGNVTFVKEELVGDSRFLNDLASKVSLIIHSAGPSRIRLDQDHKNKYRDLTLRISISLADATQKFSNIRKLIYFSSYYVYLNATQPESGYSEDQVLCCENPYGKLHLENEGKIKACTDKYQVLRLSTVFGPYGFMNKIQSGGALGFFIKKSFEEKKINIHGSGTQKMDFVYIRDFLDALELISSKEGLLKNVFNIGSGRETSITELAQTIRFILREKFNTHIEICKTPSDEKIPDLWNPIKKIKERLGISPKISLEEGIAQTISFYLKHEKNPVF